MKPDNLIFFFLQILILIESVLGLSKNNPNGLDTYTKEEFKKIPVVRLSSVLASSLNDASIEILV